MTGEWFDLGASAPFKERGLSAAHMGHTKLAVSYAGGVFGVVSGVCNHAGGPLGEGTLDGDYVTCPWHYYKFHRATGQGEPGFEDDAVPSYECKEENGHLWVRAEARSKRSRVAHAPHPLARHLARAEGPTRVLGLSTTMMDVAHPRYSTSEALLDAALAHAGAALGCDTQRVRLAELRFRACEGFYSKSAHACTWPCSITQMDPDDQLDRVYEGLVHWADVVVVATPIRWGAPSALYFKMAERLNCIQNQLTLREKVLIRNKVAAFVITGGQDNVQAVAGQQLGFFAELGFVFPPFPYVAHSRGWSAEDMENNVRFVQQSEALREGARGLVGRAVELSRVLVGGCAPKGTVARGGRKAHGAGGGA